jgi:hypothetical protein
MGAPAAREGKLVRAVLSRIWWLRCAVGWFHGWVSQELLWSLLLLRSFFLWSLENPEPLTCSNASGVVLALAGGAFGSKMRSS